jgi:hypothetical protein
VEILVHALSLSFRLKKGKQRGGCFGVVARSAFEFCSVFIHMIRALFLPRTPPMNLKEGAITMQVTVTVSDAIVREAGVRGLPVIDFVESLIDKGMNAAQGRPVLDSAMERIRALRVATQDSKY